ncbi:hypothetical protein NEMIN01_1203 [Nematocida minor]|uniref:uncharacterized protein n=1 Tax=Nematocida minor TaxID=1912983 RepID=UPI00221F2911|nr:uncharacterized protein NEMIN01_1203 [Nematocida minor]KAI5190801.1 hypothetical protein NEMIN01_1203 [Nematocida minor]
MCALSLFLWVQRLDIDEMAFSALSAGPDADIKSFNEIGECLADFIMGKREGFFLRKTLDCKSNKKIRILETLKDVLSCIKRCTETPFNSQRAECIRRSAIFQYLATKGRSIAEGYFTRSKALESKNLQNTQENSAFIESRQAESRIGLVSCRKVCDKDAIWTELVRKKTTMPYCADFLQKCKEKTKVSAATAISFQEIDANIEYDLCIAKYYSIVNKQNGSGSLFLSDASHSSNVHTQGPYFYKFKLNK